MKNIHGSNNGNSGGKKKKKKKNVQVFHSIWLCGSLVRIFGTLGWDFFSDQKRK